MPRDIQLESAELAFEHRSTQSFPQHHPDVLKELRHFNNSEKTPDSTPLFQILTKWPEVGFCLFVLAHVAQQ